MWTTGTHALLIAKRKAEVLQVLQVFFLLEEYWSQRYSSSWGLHSPPGTELSR